MKKRIALLLALAMTFCAGAGSAMEYTMDDEGSEVELIQEALLALNFYYGDITGHYGERTARGVRLFQADEGIAQTGVADDETRARLYQAAGMTPPALGDVLVERGTTLRRDDTGSEVVWLQESLTALGFYAGEISGSYGTLTQEAVRLFQRAHGLSSDGVAGRNTIRALAQAMQAEEETPGETEDAEDIPMPTTLKLGAENSAVRQLQENLEELGFYTGEITGRFGRLTKEGVRLFQRAHDIPSDGVAGPVTLAAIAGEIERKHATPVPMETPMPTMAPMVAPTKDPYNGLVEHLTPVPTSTPSVATTPLVGINSSVGFLSIEREMKLYDQSEDVRQLQIALNALGYYSASASGYFDLPTQAAVMGYQAAKGLTVNGTANQVTLITINDDIFRRLVNAVD